MHLLRRAASLLALPLILTACAEKPAPPSMDAAQGVDDGVCRVTPTSAGTAVGSMVVFTPTPACGLTRRKAEIRWEGAATPERVGFMERDGAGCTSTTKVGGRTWKVLRCAPGPVKLTIYADSTGGTELQEIEIGDGDSTAAAPTPKPRAGG